MINVEKVSNGYIIRYSIKGKPSSSIAKTDEELIAVITDVVKQNSV